MTCVKVYVKAVAKDVASEHKLPTCCRTSHWARGLCPGQTVRDSQ